MSEIISWDILIIELEMYSHSLIEVLGADISPFHKIPH